MASPTADLGAPSPLCCLCDKAAAHRVQNISRRNRKVLLDAPYCAEHVQAQIRLAATPNLGMTDIEILPLNDGSGA
jgi:hypothetical protein